jgi:Nucleotide modification associated domain 1
MSDTNRQYDRAVQDCRDIFIKKTKDYGTSWRVLRPISIIDQLFIKAQRIRTIQEKGTQMIADNVTDEFRGMVNHGVIGLIQLSLRHDAVEDIPVGQAEHWYDENIHETKMLMLAKNHDYGEAWRSMSQESFVDLILMKLMRMRQIIANKGETLISEGLDANYRDIINYSVFALIMSE